MTAKSVSEYLECIKEIVLSNNLVTWYRGQADKKWDLQPSIWRDFTREKERAMNHEFLWKAKARTSKPPLEKDWPGWLSLMQHFGLPTRLLDWSKSPLIALYFALEKYNTCLKNGVSPECEDATVWALFPGQLNIVAELEPVIYSIYTQTAIEMISPAFLNPLAVVENNKIMAVSAIEDDMRMITQQSAFTIHSSQIPLNKYDSNNIYLRRIDIPKENFQEIAIELNLLGFVSSQVFPDLEHLSSDLKYRYKYI